MDDINAGLLMRELVIFENIYLMGEMHKLGMMDIDKYKAFVSEMGDKCTERLVSMFGGNADDGEV